MDFAALQHSVFLQALGSAILNSLWQCFILWLIYETVSVSSKAASARFKNNLASLLLFFSFAWFLTSFVSRIVNRQHITAAIPNGFAAEAHAGVHPVSGFGEFLSYASASLPYLSVAYIFLLFFLISRLFAAYHYVSFISNKRLRIPTGDLQLFASRVAAEIGITKKIGVWISHHIDVPATIGFFKPVILIPLASINNLSGQQLEAIILHELAHIRRNDYVTNLIISVIETILFFNPFVVLLSNVIKRERENCCDDFVLQYRYDPHSYASALLRLEQSRMSKLKLAIGAVSGKKQLLLRIKRITNNPVASRQFNYGQKIVALLLVTGIICSVAWLSPEEKKAVPQKPLTKNNPAPLLKAKAAYKMQSRIEITVADKAIENLPPVSLRHAAPKSDLANPVPFVEADIENLALNNSTSDDENGDESDMADGGAVTNNNVDFRGGINVKQLPIFFDEKNLKLPPLDGIQNFLLQNMNINIDFSKIDMGQWNKNLKQAYKEINALDWKKVENDIRQSFAKMKPGKLSQKPGKLLQMEQDAIADARAKILSGENLLIDQKLDATGEYLHQLKTEAWVPDSLQVLQMRLLNNARNIQQLYGKAQRKFERDQHRGNNDNYYYNYSNTNTISADNTDAGEKKTCDQKKSPVVPGKKTLKIIISRIQNNTQTGVLSDKKGLQFSFSKDDDEKPNHESVISVEVNN